MRTHRVRVGGGDASEPASRRRHGTSDVADVVAGGSRTADRRSRRHAVGRPTRWKLSASFGSLATARTKARTQAGNEIHVSWDTATDELCHRFHGHPSTGIVARRRPVRSPLPDSPLDAAKATCGSLPLATPRRRAHRPRRLLGELTASVAPGRVNGCKWCPSARLLNTSIFGIWAVSRPGTLEQRTTVRASHSRPSLSKRRRQSGLSPYCSLP